MTLRDIVRRLLAVCYFLSPPEKKIKVKNNSPQGLCNKSSINCSLSLSKKIATAIGAIPHNRNIALRMNNTVYGGDNKNNIIVNCCTQL